MPKPQFKTNVQLSNCLMSNSWPLCSRCGHVNRRPRAACHARSGQYSPPPPPPLSPCRHCRLAGDRRRGAGGGVRGTWDGDGVRGTGCRGWGAGDVGRGRGAPGSRRQQTATPGALSDCRQSASCKGAAAPSGRDPDSVLWHNSAAAFSAPRPPPPPARPPMDPLPAPLRCTLHSAHGRVASQGAASRHSARPSGAAVTPSDAQR